MLYLGGILLLASLLALGQAAPLGSNAQRFSPYRRTSYQEVLDKISELAQQESIGPADMYTIASLIGAFSEQQATGQNTISVGWPRAKAETSFDADDAARLLNDLVQAFNGRQQEEEMASQQRTLHREDYGRMLGALGGILG